jgi:hypothetical protein
MKFLTYNCSKIKNPSPRKRFMLSLEKYLKERRKQIIDYLEQNNKSTFKITGEVFDRLTTLLTRKLPYGSSVDKVHTLLANAIICSLWCGWYSQHTISSQDHDFKYANFRRDYVEDFRNVITRAFEIGKDYSAVRP